MIFTGGLRELLRCWSWGKRRGWLILTTPGLALCTCLGACTTPLSGMAPPRVFSLETTPPKAVPAGCPVTLSFQAEGQVDLVNATVTWKVSRAVPGGRIVHDQWYTILPIAEHVSAPKTRGLIALQLRPRTEGTYDYAVAVEDTHGAKSNVLYRTILVSAATRAPCPPADPPPPPRAFPALPPHSHSHMQKKGIPT